MLKEKGPSKQRIAELRKVERIVKYRFKDKVLLNRALTHSSYANEHQLNPIHDSNERLEFLGDAVLELIISDMLLREFPDSPEGALSKIRADLVNGVHLAKVGKVFEVGDILLLGKGEEKTQGRTKASILANCVEALIGAIYLDGGYKAVFKSVHAYFSDVLRNLDQHIIAVDHKTRLQEILQKRFKRSPRYLLISQSGPDHNKVFHVAVEFRGVKYGRGKGKSKREAEQMAAEATIKECLDKILNAENGPDGKGCPDDGADGASQILQGKD